MKPRCWSNDVCRCKAPGLQKDLWRRGGPAALFALLPAALLFVALCGCAAPRARVAEVTATRHVIMVRRADKELFLNNRASLLNYENVLLPVSERREEFYVRWTGPGVDSVKFEYRQINFPNKLMERTFVPNGRCWNVFAVAGDDFINGGDVSAWQVSLWGNGRLLAEQKSALW
jgi:hypothetical protein